MGLLDRVKGFFRKHDKLVAVFFDEVGSLRQQKIKYHNNLFETGVFGDKETYIVDQGRVYDHKKLGKMAFYNAHDPQPLKLGHARNEEIDALGFRKILDDKTVQELFSDDALKLIKLALILIGINMLISIVIMLVEFKVVKLGGAA